LLAAAASYLQARASGGQWLLRIEDIDPPREIPGSAGRIEADLRRFGMRSDRPVLFQSTRTTAYRNALQELLDRELAYWCGCSRADLPPSGAYPGTCRNGLPTGKRRRAVRLRTDPEPVRFTDLVQGEVAESLQQTIGTSSSGGPDGLPAYQLACGRRCLQHITEIVRGATCWLPRHARSCCNAASTPRLAMRITPSQSARRLQAEQAIKFRSDPVRRQRSLQAALRFLGQPCPSGLDLGQTWRWARDNWSLSRVPRGLEIPLTVEHATAG
jgi:glutamyl-Q tRNA(Asp) synthetase